jgi:hypothetical protein
LTAVFTVLVVVPPGPRATTTTFTIPETFCLTFSRTLLPVLLGVLEVSVRPPLVSDTSTEVAPVTLVETSRRDDRGLLAEIVLSATSATAGLAGLGVAGGCVGVGALGTLLGVREQGQEQIGLVDRANA